jgi:hypothetical protein
LYDYSAVWPLERKVYQDEVKPFPFDVGFPVSTFGLSVSCQVWSHEYIDWSDSPRDDQISEIKVGLLGKAFLRQFDSGLKEFKAYLTLLAECILKLAG